jgi:hypothetical protein
MIGFSPSLPPPPAPDELLELAEVLELAASVELPEVLELDVPLPPAPPAPEVLDAVVALVDPPPPVPVLLFSSPLQPGTAKSATAAPVTMTICVKKKCRIVPPLDEIPTSSELRRGESHFQIK